jgi:hypothetical protein
LATSAKPVMYAHAGTPVPYTGMSAQPLGAFSLRGAFGRALAVPVTGTEPSRAEADQLAGTQLTPIAAWRATLAPVSAG